MNKVGAHVQDGGGILATAGTKPNHSGYAGQGNWKEDFLPKA